LAAAALLLVLEVLLALVRSGCCEVLSVRCWFWMYFLYCHAIFKPSSGVAAAA
jgi:hypothetical protein